VWVVDEGPGLPVMHGTADLFAPFRRSPDEEPSQRGTGLGLAIVKAIVVAHGGDVVVGTPAEGKGAGIGVRLPIGADPTPSVAKVLGYKPDVVFTAAAGSAAVSVYRAFQQQGFSPSKIVNTGATVDQETFFNKVDQSAVDGSYYSYEFETYDDTSNADVKTYRDAMKKYSPVDGKSEFYQWGFADIMTIYNIAKKVGGAEFSQKSYLDFMKNVEGENVFMGGALSKKSAPPAAPQIVQPTIRIVQYKGGKVVPVSDGFFNPLAASGQS